MAYGGVGMLKDSTGLDSPNRPRVITIEGEEMCNIGLLVNSGVRIGTPALSDKVGCITVASTRSLAISHCTSYSCLSTVSISKTASYCLQQYKSLYTSRRYLVSAYSNKMLL
jgi:hypothetical protein